METLVLKDFDKKTPLAPIPILISLLRETPEPKLIL